MKLNKSTCFAKFVREKVEILDKYEEYKRVALSDKQRYINNWPYLVNKCTKFNAMFPPGKHLKKIKTQENKPKSDPSMCNLLNFELFNTTSDNKDFGIRCP